MRLFSAIAQTDRTGRLFVALWGLAFAALFYGLWAAEMSTAAFDSWQDALPEWLTPLALVAAAHYVVRPFSPSDE